MTLYPLFQNTFNLRRPRLAKFCDIIKIATMLIKTTFEDSKNKNKLKELETTCKNDCISVFLDLTKVAGFR